MLRIDMIHTKKSTVFHLEGHLTGEWVEALRVAWVDARPRDRHVREYADLNNVTRVDSTGLHLLHVMNLAGVRFVATAPYTVSLLEDFEGPVLERVPDEEATDPAKRFRIRIEAEALLRPPMPTIHRA